MVLRYESDAKELSGQDIHRKSFYERRLKRLIDFCGAICFVVLFWWLYIVVAIFVKIKLGSPVLFVQKRPGKNEHIFELYKFRTMTNQKGLDGKLLPDDQRLTEFGKWLRSTSLDELPEIFNILKGDMSFVGPRPQLVRDMVFMSSGQRQRHSVAPGLTGLAQVNGRNSISWEDKIRWDLQYIEHISFYTDMVILVKTFFKVFRREDISAEGMETAEDYGDYLLHCRKISQEKYDRKQIEAKEIMERGEV